MTIFRIFSVLGLLLSLADFIGFVTSSPICKAGGCALVNQLTPYGSIPFIIAGILLFSFLLIVSFYKKIHFLIDYAVSFALIVEGVLLGYQEFYLNSFCKVCLGIAFIIGFLFLIRMYSSKNRSIAVFSLIIFIALFFISGFLYNPVWHPPSGRTLIYSKDCSHCESIIAKIHKDKLNIRMVPLQKAKSFLLANGISVVPVLVSKNNSSIRIAAGDTAITKVLFPFEWYEDIFKGLFSRTGRINGSGSCDFNSIKDCR